MGPGAKKPRLGPETVGKVKRSRTKVDPNQAEAHSAGQPVLSLFHPRSWQQKLIRQNHLANVM